MKIVFLGTCSSFTEGMTYQDNLLAEVAVKKGHEVIFISNAEKYVNGMLSETEPCDMIINGNIRLIRLPYIKIGPPIIFKKLRIFKGVYSVIQDIRPDIIFCHNHHYLSVLDVVKYKRKCPDTIVFADTHVNENNSAQNWLSLNILHRLYYASLTKRLLPVLNKYFYIGEPEKLFAKKIYRIPDELMEYLPLGGFALNDEEYSRRRDTKREELGLKEDELLFVHSGKLDKKKRTEELIEAFSKAGGNRAILAIIGSLDFENSKDIQRKIEADKRILFLGWKNADELFSYLCAGDVYCQPGSVSATMQNAICCRNAVISYPHQDYVKNIGFDCFYWCQNDEELLDTISRICEDRNSLLEKKSNALKCAKQLLDYNVIFDKIMSYL